MLRNSPVRSVFLIGMLIAFFLDGSLFYSFSSVLSRSYSAVPCVLLLWLILAVFLASGVRLHLEFWAAVAGALFDWYYTGILGVLIFILPLLVYLTRILNRIFPGRFSSALLICGIDLSGLLFLGALVNRFVSKLTGTIPISGVNFTLFDALPTLVLNLIVFSALYFPIQWLYRDFRTRRR